MSKWTWPGCACLGLLLHAWSGQAQAQTYEDEYLRRLKVFQTIDPHGETPFGEQLNPYTGDLSFKQADVVLPGTGPTISLVRQTASFQRSEPRNEPRALGDWELSIPRIETITGAPRGEGPLPQPGTLWKTGASETARCTQFAPPLNLLADDAWHGFTLFTEDGNQQELLKRDLGNTRQPSMTLNGQPIQFPVVTKQNWQIGCLPATSNGEVGEAFLVVSPDGTRYWLNYLVGERMPDYIERDIFGNIFYGRALATMYVTRIEDRFGNWVKYLYNGDEKLDAITASDGRHVTITWRSDRRVIDHITVEPGSGQRVWQYTYNGEKLASVILPDASRWTFDLHGVGGDGFSDEEACGITREKDNSVSSSGEVSTLVHPSGLTGTFTLDSTWHARNYVPSGCSQPPDPRETNPPLFGTWSLIKKQFSGAGITTKTWTYSYPDAIGSALRDACAANDSCPDTKAVTVTTPGGDRVIHTYSNRWGAHEGKLLSTKYYQGASTLLRTETHAYMQPDAGPWPAILGHPLVLGNSNLALQQTWTPQWQRTTTQQGETFQYAVSTFDSFARPVTVTRDSSLNTARVDRTSFHDNLADWVLGQVKTTTIEDTENPGIQIQTARTEYTPNDLPWMTYAYGKLQQTLTYYTDGTLHTVKDGRNYVTTLSDWKRGIPQTIQFPATPDQPSGTSISAVVNDHGWIDATTDENGYKTCYGYDPMGRLDEITYPSESTVGVCNASTWAPTYRTFSFVTAQYGLPAHRRLWERTGNGYKVTHYDALLRPVVEDTYDYGDVADTRSIVVKRYDAAGRLAFQSYPMRTLDNYAAVTWGFRTSYDALGRVTRVEQDSELGDLVTTTDYLTDFKTRVTNPRGFQATTSYMAYDTPSTDWPVYIIHPEGAYTSIIRDVFGKPLTLARRNADTSVWNGRFYAYDVHQRLCKVSEPETGTNAMGYDAAGNLEWSASGQSWSPQGACLAKAAVTRRVDRTYDARNRLLTLTFPDGIGNQAWFYTPDGLPEQIVTWNGFDFTLPVINAYHYNKRRLLDGQGESIEQDGWYTWGIGYGYDRNAHLAAQTYPDGLAVTYAPNALGQATEVRGGGSQPWAWGARYYPNGALESFNYGNGIAYHMTPNARQLPEWVGASGALLYRYIYDANANVAEIYDHTGPYAPDRSMTYDGLDRLKTADSPMFGGKFEYWYNVVDNLTRVVTPGPGGGTRLYCYNGSKQLAFVRVNATWDCNQGPAETTLEYDAQGNVATKDAQTFAFDYGNRLRRAYYAGNAVEAYRYDGHGRRVLAWSPTQGNILSQYASNGQLMYQTNARSDQVIHYFYLAGSLVATRETAFGTSNHVPKFQHTDALGSPVAVTDASGNVVERFEYAPYGQRIDNESREDGPGYTGHVLDTATGLNYMQQRYYDPGIGRFLSVDPIAPNASKGTGFNRYSYAGNNPYVRIDPDGRNWFNINDKWEWHKGSTYTANGETYKSNYTHLLALQSNGTTKTGATSYIAVLFNQNKPVMSGNYFSGGSGHSSMPNGNYTIRGDIKDAVGPKYVNPDSPLKNPPPFYGMQVSTPNGILERATGQVWDMAAAYGPIRAYLNPWNSSIPNSTGNYLHGQSAVGPGSTHGCMCYGQNTAVINYLWDLGQRVPVSVNTNVQYP